MTKKGAIVLANTYPNPTRKTNTQILAGRLLRVYRKYLNQIIACGVLLIVMLKGQRADALGLFDSAEKAMACMFTNGAQGGPANTLLQALPNVLFTGLTIIIFVYFAVTGVQVLKAFQGGEEVTQIMQQPLIGFIVLLILWIFQNILFGNAAC